ncbi:MULTISPECIES: hypothetical protein [Pseudanabaena]|jgi:hypothetical protein|uniref:hypothetical protein n=1 Tax=Pseudanabaena TaxID=1152 RepID=UPI0024785A88|nr:MULTISPECIES: hypothetical protein [Pseudanabaena]MEA5487270.1 hypothetical protein [Pseudanabaena sp. CCNP1317]WGS70487.1 hypothetical protein OA858_12165 [Pseudanabaena galeata CCNP1313]
MQVLPSHSQRQLVSGKVGWGWRQATYPISANFIFAGLLIFGLAIAQLVRLGDASIMAIVVVILIVGFVVGLYTAKSVVEVCRQNSDYLFSRSQLIGMTAYWLVLIAGLSVSSEAFAKSLIALWWILPAAIFAGMASSLAWRSGKSKTAAEKKQIIEAVNADILNVITYSDQTVLVSPSAIGQQPRQFNSLVLIVLGFFFWTMLDFSANLRAIAAIALTASGLTGFFTWQAQLRSPEKILHLRFSGLWGIDAEYAIDLRPFSSLSVVKLQEASGELSWMQLSGNKSDITIPLAMTVVTSSTKESPNQNDQLGQTIRDQFHLAKQESERDSLGMANVLLPQGAGILAGTAFIMVGGLLLFIFPLPTNLSAESAIAWLGVCLVSPAIARFFLQLVAPNSLQSDPPSYIKNHLQPWEIGTALLLISAFLSRQTTENITSLGTFNQSLPLLTLICGWLSISIGVCILSFVRRTPLWNTNY